MLSVINGACPTLNMSGDDGSRAREHSGHRPSRCCRWPWGSATRSPLRASLPTARSVSATSIGCAPKCFSSSGASRSTCRPAMAPRKRAIPFCICSMAMLYYVSVAGTVRMLSESSGRIPEMIVVSIPNVARAT